MSLLGFQIYLSDLLDSVPEVMHKIIIFPQLLGSNQAQMIMIDK